MEVDRKMSSLHPAFLFMVLQLASPLLLQVVSGQRSFVLELTEDTIADAIDKYDVILVEFYAPWCGHCQRLAPQYEVASQVLFRDAPLVKLAKIDADKFRSSLSKYNIGGYPTLRLYANGLPVEEEYTGPRSAEAIVSYVKSSLVPAISTLSSQSELTAYMKNVSNNLPIFIGFGMNTSELEGVSNKYKRKAWFAVIQDVSDKMMMDFDFDKMPVLVGLHPQLEEQSAFYGPFHGDDLGDFVQLNLLPLVSPLDDGETVRRLKADGRPIAIGIVDGSVDDMSHSFIKKLKMAAPANRGFVFAYVDTTKWSAFVEPFGISKASKLPTVVIWNRKTQFSISDDEEAFVGVDAEAQLTRLLHDFKENRLQLKNFVDVSLLHKVRSVIFGGPALFVVCTLIILVFAVQGCDWSTFKGQKDLADDLRDRGRRTDLEGDIVADRNPADDLLFVSRKIEKRD